MHTETFKVAGMTCNGCTSKVAHALNAIKGVHDVVVSLSNGEVAIRYDEHVTAIDKLKSAVKGAGYDVDITNVAQKPQSKQGCCS